MLNHHSKDVLYLCITFTIFVSEIKPYGNANNIIEPHIKINKVVQNVTSPFHSEGGLVNDKNVIINKIAPTQSTFQSDGGPVSDKEHLESTSLKTTTLNVSPQTSVHTTINQQPIVVPHGREGIVATNKAVNISLSSNTTVNNVTSTTTTEKIIPVREPEVKPPTKEPVALKVTEKNILSSTTEKLMKNFLGDSKIKPRKGAPTDIPEITTIPTSSKPMTNNSTTSNSTTSTPSTKPTTVKPKKMKPTVTIGVEDEPYAPSNFLPRTKNTKNLHNDSADSKQKSSDYAGTKYFKSSESYIGMKYFKQSPDYVLPIVLTILAVPLVAILIAVLYKRGSEWWQHRHYRRMDFLIEGMYNN